jgi:hypothetical protein
MSNACSSSRLPLQRAALVQKNLVWIAGAQQCHLDKAVNSGRSGLVVKDT